MFALIVIPILIMIVVAGYQELRYGPSSKGRPRREVMHLVDFRETRDNGFAG